MMRQPLLIMLTAGWLVASVPATGDESDNYPSVRQALNALIPGQPDYHIQPSPIDGIVEVRTGLQVFYASADGQHLINGPLYGLPGGDNLTENTLAVVRQQVLADAGDVPLIEYPAPAGDDGSAQRRKITVITDIDCPYCRQLHQALDSYHQAGFDLAYIMLPRAGKGSESYHKTVSAVCAVQPAQQVTLAMNGQTPAPASCDHPIDQHMNLARSLGAVSTPNILLPDGTLIRGYKTAAELEQMLEQAR